jgi:hypothetical protein
MAVIKTHRNALAVAALFEDPIPGGDYIYFQNDAYYKTTLAPLYDLGLVWNTTPSVTTGGFGYSNPVTYIESASYQPGRIQGLLLLTGETTHVRHFSAGIGVNNSSLNNMDISPFVSMDTTNKCTPVKYYTDGTNSMVLASYNHAQNNTPYNNYARYYIHLQTAFKFNTTSKDLLTSNYWNAINSGYATTPARDWLTQNGSYPQQGYGSFPIYRNPATGNLVWVPHYYYNPNNAANNWTPAAKVGHAWQPIMSANPTSVYTSQEDTNATGQFVGASKLDFQGIFFHNFLVNDYTHTFYKYNDQTNTYTTLNAFSTAPPIPGTGGIGTYNLDRSTLSTVLQTSTWYYVFTATNFINTFTGKGTVSGSVLTVNTVTSGALAAGMTLTQISYLSPGGVGFSGAANTGTVVSSLAVYGTNQGGDRLSNFGQYIPKFASKTFTDTSVANTMGFYSPAVDQSGNFQPLYFQWQQSPTDNFTRNSDLTVNWGGASQSTYWTPDTVSNSSYNNTYGMQRCWYTETYVSSSTRFLILMQLHGAGGVYDSVDTAKTFPVFTINTATYKTLTYHSKLSVPATPKNIVWLSDDRLILGIICTSNFYVFSFSAATGWIQIGNFPYQFNAVGRDNLGRIWAHDTGLGYGRLHLLTINVPVSISVVTDSSSYNYGGTTVTGNLTVNAYSYSGARLATSVKLVIDGGSMTFTGNNLTLTVTTSASADTLVPIYITGGGVSNIIASAAIS